MKYKRPKERNEGKESFTFTICKGKKIKKGWKIKKKRVFVADNLMGLLAGA